MINPSSPPSTGFNLATVSSAGYILEEQKGLTITINYNILTSFTPTPGSFITNNPNTLYSFTLGNNDPLVNGYSIQISFPSDYTFLNYSSMICTVAGSIMPCGRLNSTYSTSNNTVLIRVNSTVNTVGTVTISSVTNPISKATTGVFSAKIIDSSGTTV